MNIPTLEKPYHYDGGNYYEDPKEYQEIIKEFLTKNNIYYSNGK